MPNTPATRTGRLGAVLRQRRLERNLSQKKLGERSGIGPSTINQIERVAFDGKFVGMPGPDTLRALARGLSVDGFSGDPDDADEQALYDEFMATIGYAPPTRVVYVTIPPVVIRALAKSPDIEIRLGLTNGEWSESDTATALRMIELAQRRAASRNRVAQ